MGGRRRCCCGCVQVEDLFEREDSDTVGNNWEECSGDWEIAGGHLTTNDEDAIIVWKHEASDHVGLFDTIIHIRDGATFSSVGAKYRILAYIGSVGDACTGTAEWMLEMDITNETTGLLTLYQDGVEVDHRHLIFSTLFTNMELCISTGVITANSNDISGGPIIWACHDEIDNLYFALGCGNTYQVYYESAWFSEHHDHDEKCPNCNSPCCCSCIESERPYLTLTIDAPGCSMDGEYGFLECSGLPGECCVWNLTEPITFLCPDGVYGFTYALNFQMRCMSNPGDNSLCSSYDLSVSWPPASSNYVCCDDTTGDQSRTRDAEEDCSCDPLSIRFGPYRLWKKDSFLGPLCCDCCEEFWVDVTL